MENLSATQIAIFISALLAAVLAYAVFTNTTNTADARYAATAAAMVDGAVNYAATERSNILGGTIANPVLLSGTTGLIAAGAVDPSISPNTPTGGQWCLEFRSYVTNGTTHLQGLVGSANETRSLKSGDAALVAAATGRTFAGYVTGSGATAAATGPDFSQLLSAFTGSTCNFLPNAFVAVITDNEAIGTTNWLARVAIPGNPSASTMTVDLNMGGNNLTNALSVAVVGSATEPGTVTVGTATTAGTVTVGTAGTAGTMTVNGTASISGATATGALTINGNGTATGTMTATSFIHTSDGRLKTNWRDITDPFAVLAPIHFGRFTWIGSGIDDYGVEAQSLEATLPELVHVDENGRYAVSYDGLIPVLMAAVSQTHADAVAARTEADAAQAEVKTLRRRIAGLTAANDNVAPLHLASGR